MYSEERRLLNRILKNRKTTDADSRSRRPLMLVVIAVVFLLAFATAVLINTVNKSIYSERKESLSETAEASAQTVNETMRDQHDKALIIKNVIERRLGASQDAESFITKLGYDFNMGKDKLFLVDSNGKYCCSDGETGIIADSTYYTGPSEDEVEYLATLPHLDPSKKYLVFRFRLNKPIRTLADNAEVEYVGMMYDLEELNETVSSLFEGTNNTFIYETDSGKMLYKQFGIGILLQGYAIYPKFDRVELVNGENPLDIVRQCKEKKTVVTEMKIDDSCYYFCSTDLETDNWSLAYVVQKSYIVNSAGSAFNTVIYTIIIFFFLISIAIIAVAGMLMTRRAEKKEQEALEKANRAMTEFLFNMSHDIRTPMNAIIGFTNIASKNIDNIEKVSDSLSKIQLSGNLLLSLVNDILEFSRIESGNALLNEKCGDIVCAFNNIGTVLSSLAEEKGVELVMEADVRNRSVLFDETRLECVLINIISNGIKYTPSGGWVKAFMQQQGTENEDECVVRFVVEDNGVGMSEESIKHLFEEFFREESALTSGIQGTGLGLPLCKLIVDLMGGTIECESAVGKGSRFMIQIPFKIQSSIDYETKQADAKHEIPDLTGRRVLIVEDNALNREIATEILSELGAEVSEAENGMLAINKLSETGPDYYDMILMDIRMPVMDGYESAGEIKRMFPDSNIPMIALSANSFEEDKRKSQAAGMVAHIAKPINNDELYSAVLQCLRS
ncbi:MAG: response regulator [Clostridiales bacterium]|nr:response regulator [Candidatus Crickella caballi]